VNTVPDPTTHQRLVRTPRAGLRESLEAYAKRAGVHYAVARPYWRAEGLRALNAIQGAHVAAPILLLGRCSIGLCAVAPGVAVETKEQNLEHEEENQC